MENYYTILNLNSEYDRNIGTIKAKTFEQLLKGISKSCKVYFDTEILDIGILKMEMEKLKIGYNHTFKVIANEGIDRYEYNLNISKTTIY
jgi:hypothetical protein